MDCQTKGEDIYELNCNKAFKRNKHMETWTSGLFFCLFFISVEGWMNFLVYVLFIFPPG